MAKTYVNEGDVVVWTNGGSAVTAGTVIPIGKILGVALVDIAGSASGAVQIEGVFTCPKNATHAINIGESVIWDVSAGNFDYSAATPATGDVSGAPAVCVESAGSSATTVKIRFTGVPGTVT
jgi:predicted RecA/RadA family phage recombinase